MNLHLAQVQEEMRGRKWRPTQMEQKVEDNIQKQQPEGFMVDKSQAQLLLLFVGKYGNCMTE